ncbi:MAG: hypothetical protein Kow0020_10250 [Wenzhouxiangellaceae bacterium]
MHAVAGAIEQGGASVYEQARVRQIRRSGAAWLVETDRACIEARQLVLATGGYGFDLYRRGQRAVLPISTYVMVTEALGPELERCVPGRGAIYDSRFAFDYYRPLPDGRLLWGGRIAAFDRAPESIARVLKRDLGRVFPALAGVGVEYAWSGQMSYARHQMPVLTEFEPGLWLALGFGGHGLAPTWVAGRVLAEALTGDPERLSVFRNWSAAWAGGLAGRAAAQLVYWYKQGRDALRQHGRR